MNKVLHLFLAVILSSITLAAQETPAELSFEECARQALLNNPGLRAKKASLDQSKYLYSAAYNDHLPKINLSNSVSRSGGDGQTPSNRWRMGVSASEPIFNLKTVSSIKNSKLNYEKALNDYRAESAGLRQSLHSAFLNLLLAQEKTQTYKKVMALREQNSKLIHLKYESGMESKGNMMYAAALYEISKADASKAERALNAARRELLRTIGAPDDTNVRAKGEIKLPQYTLDRSAAAELAGKSPQVLALEKSRQIYKERMLTARYDALPTISASQSMDWSGPSEFPQSRSWALGLTLSLPLFSNGPTYFYTNTKAAAAALKSAEESLKELKHSITNDILSNYDDFLNALETAAANSAVLAANEQRYSESQIKYMAGKLSFLDLEDVEQRLVDSRLNQFEYIRNAHLKKLAVENLLGVGLEN